MYCFVQDYSLSSLWTHKMMVPRPKSTIMVPPWYHHEVPPFLLSPIKSYPTYLHTSISVHILLNKSYTAISHPHPYPYYLLLDKYRLSQTNASISKRFILIIIFKFFSSSVCCSCCSCSHCKSFLK